MVTTAEQQRPTQRGLETGPVRLPDASAALRADALTTTSGDRVLGDLSPIRQGDVALSGMLRSKPMDSSFVVRDNRGGSFFDFALAEDIYRSPYSASAVRQADERLAAV
jgi:hypothetical protein